MHRQPKTERKTQTDINKHRRRYRQKTTGEERRANRKGGRGDFGAEGTCKIAPSLLCVVWVCADGLMLSGSLESEE